MKNKFIILLSLMSTMLFADNAHEKILWASAYDGDFCMVHHLCCIRNIDSFNDEVMQQCAMAYMCYRLGDEKGLKMMFKCIDLYIEANLFYRLD